MGTLGLQTYTGGCIDSTYGYNAGTPIRRESRLILLIDNVGVIGGIQCDAFAAGLGNAQVNRPGSPGWSEIHTPISDYVTIKYRYR